MKEFAFDITIDRGPAARTVRLTLPRFTLLATTTDKSKAPERVVSAFGAVYHLVLYTPHELQSLVMRAAETLHTDIDKACALAIAQKSNGLPKDAIRLLKRIRDFAEVKNESVITKQVAEEAFSTLALLEPKKTFSQEQSIENREPIPDWMRRAVLERDNGICRYFGRRAMTFHLDHVIPVSQGGHSTVANLVTACVECNRKKGGRTPDEAGMALLPVETRRE